MRYVKWGAYALGLILFAGVAIQQEAGEGSKDKKSDKKSADKPATYKVAKGPFKVELSFSGILSSEDASEISFRPHPMLHPPEGQSSLVVKKVVAHGAAVKKGDVLVALDTTKMDDVIANAELEQKALQLSIRLTEEELPLQEKAAPIELAAAESAKKRADEELKYFLDTGRAQAEKEAHMSVKSMKFYLEYAEEELVQLKKMYKANDLTEETERMILRRQQNQVERLSFGYQSALLDRDYTLKTTLPNKEKSLKEDQAKQTLLLEKARKTWVPWLEQKRGSLAKSKQEFANGAERLAKLAKDRAAMTITAPVDGVAYHGRFHQGNWNLSESVESKLLPGATVQPDKVLLTIVQPRAALVYVNVDEKDAHLLKADMRGMAKFVARPGRKATVRVKEISRLPSAPGKYGAVIRLDEPSDELVPGLACTVKFVPYATKDALTVPTKCIFDEDDKDMVYVQQANGKHVPRTVTLGHTDGTNTEILEGLRVGDLVLLERPKSKGETP
ncbi:MAG TPA: HlyD family efflux transporter periplasmic adaptor subunit [Gemmataceae bacterium]|nr:HlyD family efflux transporter periplasmic adaptor subunit [Gemmataceae bacterium]